MWSHREKLISMYVFISYLAKYALPDSDDVCLLFFLSVIILNSRVWTMITLKTSSFWRRSGGWVTWWVTIAGGKKELLNGGALCFCVLFYFCLFPLFLLCLASSEFSLSGDQSLGGLRSDWLSDRPHRLFHWHRGGAVGWDQVPSGQREYPDDLKYINLHHMMSHGHSWYMHHSLRTTKSSYTSSLSEQRSIWSADDFFFLPFSNNWLWNCLTSFYNFSHMMSASTDIP